MVPISTKLGPGPLVIGHDRRLRYQQPPCVNQNSQATILTASLETGFGDEICGAALVFYAQPGRNFSMDEFNKMDDFIRCVVLKTFGDGAVPGNKVWAEWKQQFARW